MKKFLASLLSLTMLCSSVAVFCSAQENTEPLEPQSITSEKGDSLVDGKNKKIVLKDTNTFTQNNPTDTETPASSNWENFKTTLIALGNDASAFCTNHQKEIAITGITTAVVAVIATTAYIFGNEIKNLAQKTANTVKEFYQKTIQKFSKTANSGNTLNPSNALKSANASK